MATATASLDAKQASIHSGNKEEENVAVIIPDYQRGVPIMQPWMRSSETTFTKIKYTMGSLLGYPGMVCRLKKHYNPLKIERDVFEMIVPFVQTQAKNAKTLSCVGFWFGGWIVGRILGHRDNSRTEEGGDSNSSSNLEFLCGVGIHPSFQPNVLHGESQSAMAGRISRPMLLLPAKNDVDLKPGTKVVNIMTKNRMANVKDKDPVVSIEFPSILHGWVARGDPTDANIAADQDKALALTVDFLLTHTHNNDHQ